MKISFQLIILLIFSAYSAVANTVKIKTDSCSPSYSLIYSFNIDDTFQYRQTSTSSAGGASPTYETITQFTIKDIIVDSNTTTYYMEGWTEELFFYNDGNSSNNVDTDTTRTIDFLSDYMVYTDSFNNFLNQCPKELIKVNYGMFEELGLSAVYSKIKSSYSDSILVKTIGGKDNLFQKNEANEIVPVTDAYFEAVYQANLGLVSQEFTFFEMRETLVLESYCKGADTVGTLLQREGFYEATANKNNDFDNDNKLLYPNPGNGNIEYQLIDINEIQVYNLSGQLVYSQNPNGRKIDLNHLNSGLYIIKLISNSGTFKTEKYLLNK